MTQAPNWTEAEFEILVTNAQLSGDDLEKILVRRSKGAIEVVRAGIHSYHTGDDISMLSKMMRDFLSQPRGTIKCPICGREI